MTEQEIMQLAKEAGFGVGEHNGKVHVLTPVYEDLSIAEYVIKFAALVAEREREACIVSFEKEADSWVAWPQSGAAKRKGVAAIRARGEKGGEA